jgi:putative transposase
VFSTVNRTQAYKYRMIVKTRELETSLSRTVGCCRFVWNRAAALSAERYPGYHALSAMLPAWKRELPWLAEVDSIALQQVLRNFDRAWKNFFENPGHYHRPTFKKRFAHDSFRFVGAAAAKAEQNRIWVPKVGWVPFRMSRHWQGRVTSVTVSRVAGRWFAALQCSVEVAEPQARFDPWIGVDVGVTEYAASSDGALYKGVETLETNRRKLVKLQRKFNRSEKGGKRRRKVALRVARQYSKMANARIDRAHKVSSQLVKNHGRIRMEDLRVKNMMKSAKGTVDAPGKKVAQKRGLNRKLADQGLRTLRTFVEYKLGWSGGSFEAVNPQYTSQECNECHYVAAGNRKEEKFKCMRCGHKDHADVNAAKNIRDSKKIRYTLSAAGAVAQKVRLGDGEVGRPQTYTPTAA